MMGFMDFMQWPHDPNLTVNTLVHILSECLPAMSKKRSLPEKLYIQLDNCVRENKNKFVLTFLALLVQIGIFKEVSVL